MAETINIEEYLKELERFTPKKDDPGYTTPELVAKLGLGTIKTREFLKEGLKQGKIVAGTRHVPKDWDGRPRDYRVYRIATKGGKHGKAR